jgi:predicted AlkP superfamily phosphohydrolase/phosphomutase
VSTKSLVLGLDGADLGLVRELGPSRLPQLFALMARGGFAALESVQPPATLPNWTSFLTGLNPGEHGVFDFTLRQGYRVRFTAGSVREAPTLASALDRRGKRCACLFFPATFPPERLSHGYFISGWDAPVAFEADRSFVWPPELHDRIVARFGPQRFDDVDEFDADAPGWHARLPAALCERVARRAELGAELLRERDWDLFAIYFGECDTASHHLWALHDPRSPRRPVRVSAEQQAGLAQIYMAVDAAIGRLVAEAGGDAVEVTIVSDHGFGGSSDKVLYLNRALEQAGLLQMRPRRLAASAVKLAKEAALTRLPPALREALFRGASAVLPGLLESQARFGAIDFDRTRAFSDELNYFPAVHFNLRGREPRGTVPMTELGSLRAQVERALYALRDPWTQQPVVRRVWAREELFSGPFVARAPDLLLELHLDAGYSYNLMPTTGAPGDAPFRRLDASEYLGRKGRSLQGSHRDRGLFVAAGPQVCAAGEVQLGMTDASALVLARLGLDAPRPAPAAVLESLLHAAHTRGPSAPFTSTASGPRRRAARATHDDARVESRLRSLGYIE